MLKVFDNKIFVCGIDEAGRGCLAGPVTAAAVVLPKKYKNSSPRIKIIQKIYNSAMNPDAEIDFPKNQYKKLFMNFLTNLNQI